MRWLGTELFQYGRLWLHSAVNGALLARSGETNSELHRFTETNFAIFSATYDSNRLVEVIHISGVLAYFL
jgi:hypothetical protein